MGQPKSPPCEKCGYIRPDVKVDPASRLLLCNPCWFRTNPKDYPPIARAER